MYVCVYVRRSRRTREYRPTRVETSIASVMSSQCLLQASPPWFLPSYHAHWQYIFDVPVNLELYPRIPSRNPNNRRTCAISCLVPSWSENRMAERRNITYFNCFYRFPSMCQPRIQPRISSERLNLIIWKTNIPPPQFLKIEIYIFWLSFFSYNL